MDRDDAAPSPIRRSSREALQLQQVLQDGWLEDEDLDDAAPPSIARQRSTSLGSPPASNPSRRPSIPPIPNKSPLRSTFGSTRSPKPHTRNFSHPFKDRSRNLNPRAFRNAPRAVSYRNNPRLPPSLRRWSSLETIESVATTPSIQDEELWSPGGERPSIDSWTLDDGSSLNRHSAELTAFSLTHSDETDSMRSMYTPTPSLAPSSSASTRRGRSPRPSTGSSLLQKLKRPKFHEPLVQPEHLEIGKRVSVDQTSHRSNSSSSVMTLSSGRPSEVGYSVSTASNRSLDSKDWKASDYDISGLTEGDLKKCKKKGINPALYAEMKAARKGKWVSPIGGNTIL